MECLSTFQRRQLGKANVPTTLGGAASASLSPATGTGADTTTGLEHLTNLAASLTNYANETAKYHQSTDDLMQTGHLLLEATKCHKMEKSQRSFDLVQKATELHGQALKAHADAHAAHKGAHRVHHELAKACVKHLHKVLGGGPESMLSTDTIEAARSRLSTASAKKLAKAASAASIAIASLEGRRVSPNEGIPSRFGKGWSGTGDLTKLGAGERLRLNNSRGTR